MATQNITRKKPRKQNSRDFSSSEETEQLKLPKDVLELGKYLVRELDFEDGFDTLGRWMAHHLAELIYKAENGETEEAKLKASQQATDTILKIWKHRKNLPREAYPLAKYEELLKVINRLRISSNPYRFSGYNFQNSTDQIASILFDNFTRLILSLLLMRIDSLKSQKADDSFVVESLDEDEKQIWIVIQEWMDIFPKENKQKEKRGKNKEEIDLRKNAILLIDSINKSLIELKKELNN